MTAASPALDQGPTSAAPAAAASADRLASIDILRGAVMVVMVLDHVRDFFHVHAASFDPLDPERSWALLYATRWVTHFCAPVFVLLAGVSAYLQLARGKSRAEVSRLLVTRGLWLVLLELTLIAFGWSFRFDFIFLQVIWAIGLSMVALGALVWLPWRAVLAVGAIVVAGHNLLDPVDAADLGGLAPLWNVLIEPTVIVVQGKAYGFLAYPVLPWLGVMALGFGLGPVFGLGEGPRRRMLALLGFGLVGLFLVLRLAHGYGDPAAWTPQATPGRTLMDFLSTSKYPPSLQFVCMTIGPALLLLPLLERLKGPRAEPWRTFGAVPFFFYILHIYLVHALSTAMSLAQGYPVWGVADFFRDPAVFRGFGYDLAGVYAVWIGVVAALYLPCRWFGGIKRRHPGGWMSYL
jgi:uncharacterized membrane protein